MKARSSTAVLNTITPTPASKSVRDGVIQLDGDVQFLDQYSLKKAGGQGYVSRFCGILILVHVCKRCIVC